MNPWGIRKARGQYKSHGDSREAIVRHALEKQKTCQHEGTHGVGFINGKQIFYCRYCLKKLNIKKKETKLSDHGFRP